MDPIHSWCLATEEPLNLRDVNLWCLSQSVGLTIPQDEVNSSTPTVYNTASKGAKRFAKTFLRLINSPSPGPHQTPPRPEFSPPKPPELQHTWPADNYHLPQESHKSTRLDRSPFQPDSIPYFWCPPPGLGVTTMTGTGNQCHSSNYIDIGSRKRGPHWHDVPNLLWDLLEAILEELKTCLTGDSAKCSQQTLMVLFLPITPLQVSLSMWALKCLSRVPGAFKKAGYPAMLFCPQAKTTVRNLSLTQRCREMTTLFIKRHVMLIDSNWCFVCLTLLHPRVR